MLLIVNPVLYNDVYDDHGNPKVTQKEIDQYKVPESEADLARMMQEIQQMGLLK